MSPRRQTLRHALGALMLAGAASLASTRAPVQLFNVSYDPTRERHVEFNVAFAKHWKARTEQDVTIRQSHGGSGKQARSIVDSLEAEVATLALAGDIDALDDNGGWILKDLQKRLPHNSSPYTSAIILAAREGIALIRRESGSAQTLVAVPGGAGGLSAQINAIKGQNAKSWVSDIRVDALF